MDRRPIGWLLMIVVAGLICWGVWWNLPAKVDMHRLARFGLSTSSLQVSGSRLIVLGFQAVSQETISMVCIDTESGRKYWSEVTGFEGADPVISQDGKIAYCSSLMPQALTVLQVTNGAPLWRQFPGFPPLDFVVDSIAVTGSKLFVMGPVNPASRGIFVWGRQPISNAYTVCAILNLDTGKLITKQSFAHQFVFAGVPVADGQVIYFNTDTGGLYAYDMGNHHMLWSHAGGPYGAIGAPPLLLPDTVVFVSQEGVVTSVERKTGLILWRTLLGLHRDVWRYWTGQCVMGSTLVIPDYDEHRKSGGHPGGLIGLDIRDGHVQFRCESLDDFPSIVPLNPRVALVVSQNHLFRLSVPSGSLRHIADLPADLQYGPCVLATSSSAPHRSLLMGGSDGWVYTLNLDPLDRFLQ